MYETDPIKWGVLGPGRIAHKFAEGLRHVRGGRLTAVGSRNLSRAKDFAAMYHAPKAYGSYEELVSDGSIDAIYVATPHPQHSACCRICLEAGKHVLCEKPITVNALEAHELAKLARLQKVLLMEAMWTRFIPTTKAVIELIHAGDIGTPIYLTCDFGFSGSLDPSGRQLSRDLAGGALLDVGVYCVSLAYMILGKPTKVMATAHIGPSGVDERTSLSSNHANGAVAAMFCSVTAKSPQTATIVGTSGHITMRSPFWCSEELTLTINGRKPEIRCFPLLGNGFNYETEHFMELIRSGANESPLHSMKRSISIMETLDNIRQQINLSYPFENRLKRKHDLPKD